MNRELVTFLNTLARLGGVCTGAELSMNLDTTDAQKNARKQATKAGLAEYANGRWWLTDAGRGAIARRKSA